MYNLKRIIRQKSSWILITIFAVLFIILIFLFKYLFIVENTIEVNIYDKHKNRDIIIYDNYNKVKQELSDKEDILYIFKDYESLELNNSEIGNFNITPLLNVEMPTLIKGTYPKKENEILLPNLNFINGKKAYLTSYLGKNITLTLNNEKTLTFTVTGIYDSQNIHSIIYNLENINYLCEKLPSYIYTGYTRVIINHYKNYEKLKENVDLELSLYDRSGLDEIEIYNSLFKLVLLIVIIMIIFTLSILIIISSIMFNNSKEQRFIEFTEGYSEKNISINYIDYYIKIMVISFIISILSYILLTKIYKYFIVTDNLVLNTLFTLNINNLFLLPIIIIILTISVILYIYIYFKVKLSIKNI